MGKPKLPGRPFSMRCQESAPSVDLNTPPWNCMKSVLESFGSSTILCTQQQVGFSLTPVSTVGKPLLHSRHDSPPSVVRNTPTALMATHIRLASFGSTRMVCRHNPPLPGNHPARLGMRESAETSFQLSPRSRLTNNPASASPA